ncbi:MAG TPA: hypothetical protein VFP69_00695 [Streptomyces sp.]|nr:hypothetical protein [Streptomyces sp.]
MPRPTVAQLVCGSGTVVLSALAMLLLSGAGSVPAVAVVAVTALALGLLAAMTVARPKRASGAGRPAAGTPDGTGPAQAERAHRAARHTTVPEGAVGPDHMTRSGPDRLLAHGADRLNRY